MATVRVSVRVRVSASVSIGVRVSSAFHSDTLAGAGSG